MKPEPPVTRTNSPFAMIFLSVFDVAGFRWTSGHRNTKLEVRFKVKYANDAMKISELAEQTGLTTSAIRFYERCACCRRQNAAATAIAAIRKSMCSVCR